MKTNVDQPQPEACARGGDLQELHRRDLAGYLQTKDFTWFHGEKTEIDCIDQHDIYQSKWRIGDVTGLRGVFGLETKTYSALGSWVVKPVFKKIG